MAIIYKWLRMNQENLDGKYGDRIPGNRKKYS
jgi:hypothetical protein